MRGQRDHSRSPPVALGRAGRRSATGSRARRPRRRRARARRTRRSRHDPEVRGSRRPALVARGARPPPVAAGAPARSVLGGSVVRRRRAGGRRAATAGEPGTPRRRRRRARRAAARATRPRADTTRKPTRPNYDAAGDRTATHRLPGRAGRQLPPGVPRALPGPGGGGLRVVRGRLRGGRGRRGGPGDDPDRQLDRGPGRGHPPLPAGLRAAHRGRALPADPVPPARHPRRAARPDPDRAQPRARARPVPQDHPRRTTCTR